MYCYISKQTNLCITHCKLTQLELRALHEAIVYLFKHTFLLNRNYSYSYFNRLTIQYRNDPRLTF